MSNEELHIDGDFTLNIPHFEADFTENEQPDIQADFKIQTGGSTSFANITGDPYDNEALSDALNQKADTSTVETLSETVENNYTDLDGKITDESDARTQADADLQSNIDDVADDLSIETDNRQSADEDLQDNIDTVDGKIDTHIADKTNPHEVTKTQVGLGNVDNTSDLNKPISTATQTALNGKQDTINDLSDIRTNAENGQSAYNTIQTYGDIVTYDASSFATSTQGQKADTALQPNDNITKLNNNAGYITSASLPTVNNNKITIQKNSTDAGSFTLNQSSDKTINISVPTQASDINAVPTSRKINNKPLSSDITLTASDVNALSSSTTINDLTTSAQQNAIDSGANTTNIGQIATNTSNISSLSNTVTNNYNTLDGRITSEVSALNTAIGTETTNRQNADNNLQSQIDAIVASSDVFDIVGTYAELQAYDISTVPVNDIIKVLVDSTHSNAATYYRCVENNNVKSWSYIGSEGAYYTKSEADSLFVEQTTTVNGKALSNNITLTASDVGALPDNTVIPTVNNGTLTIQQNGTDVQTFGANQSSNVTANITVPTDTSDLTNGAGFITNSDLSGYATTTDLTNGLATKQDTLIAGTDLEIVNSTTPRLPAGFTELEWLQSDGACCIDLGVISYGNDEVEQKFQRPSTFSSDVISWFGSIQNSAVPRFSIGVSGSSGVFAGFNFTKPLAEYDNNIHIITLKKVGSTYFAGFDEATATYAPTSASTNPSINSYLFARNSSTITYDGTGTRIFYHKQNRFDGTPLLDLVPAKRDSDNALGVYNLVSNTFLGNIGTGTFIGGPEVIYPTTTTINFTNESGYIKGITSSDVITALGYTPYNSTNPDNYTSNVGTVTSVNNTQPDANGDVTLSIPTVNDGTLTITQNGTTVGTFSANQSSNDTIPLTDTTYNNFTGADGTNAGSSGLVPAPSATDNDKYLKGDGTWASVSSGSSTDVQINGTSITSGGVANIVTNTAYNASSNKIATMSDVPSISGLADIDLSNLSATGEAHFLKNTATGTDALTISGNPTSYLGGLNIGSYSTASNNYGIAIGNGTSTTNTTASGASSIAIGHTAKATAECSIQIGNGTNSTARTVCIGGWDSIGSPKNYQILDIETGLIPDARISTNIQRTSTAVTHTASTAVGSSTVPVYVNSSGDATSTGLSIASSRFDGQWVYKFLSGSSATAVGTVTIDLSSYLPSDSYKYEVLINLCLYSNPSSGGTDVFLWSDVFQNTNTGQDERVARCNTNSRASENRFTMPVGTGRWIKRQIVDKAATVSCNVSFWGYRRIGTNT